ncbi:Tetratricopeptide repeat [Prochlorococcus marinus str. MIT 1342]|uniref:tetratricopeptide repeat protein n=1 Tax=Prochlorococcus TaxID=1218 RepID=UPI0007B3BA21|nr:tetratricopeptide repeat protein [Prochlorococcus marinus]KZR83073.1 Tetratricopeptide repeat [Prochlorococcus marinus str. MIT 1342]
MAESYYKDCNYPQAINVLRQALSLKENWKSYQFLGHSLYNTNQFAEAIDAFRKSLALKEDYVSYELLGRALFYINQDQLAIDAYKKSLILQESWDGYKCLGKIYYNLTKYESSVKALRKSLELQDSQEAWTIHGWSLLCLEKYQLAVDSFEKSLQMEINRLSLKGIGQAMIFMQEYKKAIEAFVAANEIAKDWEDLIDLGWAYVNTENLAKAIEAFSESIEIHENDENHKGLAHCLTLSNKCPEAIKEFEKIKDMSLDHDTLNRWGSALTQEGQFKLAEEKFLKSINIKKDPGTYKGLAYIYTISGQHKMGIEALQSSLILREDCISYLALAKLLNNESRFIESAEAFLKYWKSMGKIKNPNNAIQHLLKTGFKGEYIGLQEFICSSLTPLSNFDQNHTKQIEQEAIQTICECIKKQGIPPILLNLISFINQIEVEDEKLGSDGQNVVLKEIAGNSREYKSKSNLQNEEVVVFGVSHAKLFDGITGVQVVWTHGGTMYGISNPKSRTGVNIRIREALSNKNPKETILVFDFGEVDLRMHIHKISNHRNISPQEVCDAAINNYMEFIDICKKQGYEIIVSGPHCGGGKSFAQYSVTTSISERNNICSYMNDRLREECDKKLFKFITLFDIGVDELTFHERNSLYSDYYHLYTPPHKTGLLIQHILKKRLTDAIQKGKSVNKQFFKKNLSCQCTILLSSISDWKNSKYFQLDKQIPEPLKLIEENTCCSLIEIPFFIHPKELTLSFEYKNAEIVTNVWALGEPFSQSKVLLKNIFGSIRKVSKYSANLISHNFMSSDFKSNHAKFFIVQISTNSNNLLNKVSISRFIDKPCVSP